MATPLQTATTKGIIYEEIIEEEEDPEEDPEEEPVEQLEEEPGKEEEDDGEEEQLEEEPVGEEEEEEEVKNEIPKSINEEKKKQKEMDFEVCVGGLHRDATENDIKMAFKKVGHIVEVKLVKDPYSNKNKGFAFVRFATVDQAKKAAVELKHTMVKGKPCGVIKNKGSVTLHVGNICTSWTKVDLFKKLKVFDLENLEDVQLIDDPHNKGKNRGYAFLDFRTHMDAVAACANLRRSNVFFGTNVRADITFSKTVEPDEEVMAEVKSVFLDGLPVNWDEAQLREHLNKFGEIESIRLACNMPTAKRKDFGFISFMTREATLDCIEKVNKDGIGEGDNKVLVKATLKKPLQKQAPALGVRGGYIGKGYGIRGKQSYGFSRSSENRPDRFKTSGRFPSRCRESSFKAPLSTKSGRLHSQYRQRSSREIPGTNASRSRSRDSYHKGSSSTQNLFTCFPKNINVELGTNASRSRSRDSYHKGSSSTQNPFTYFPKNINVELGTNASRSRSRDSYHKGSSSTQNPFTYFPKNINVEVGTNASRSRSRDSYHKGSSSNRHTPGRHSTTCSQMRRSYSDEYDNDDHYDPYDPWIEHCEAYEYVDSPGYEQAYYELPRCRYDIEMDTYEECDCRSYNKNEDSRFSPDERMDYERAGHATHYYSGRGAYGDY